MLQKFQEKAQKVMAIAESIAFDLGHASVGTEHLLLSFVKIKESVIRMELEKLAISFDDLKNDVIALLGKKDSQPFYMEYSVGIKKLIERAQSEAKRQNTDKISLPVLAYTLINYQDSVAAELLMKRDVDLGALALTLRREIRRVSELDSIDDLINLNDKFRDGEIIVTRPKEVELLTDALLRKKKPNAILVGEAGVGKTALVELLAQMIARGEVRKELADKVIYELDIASVVAGTKYRGEFEEKLKKIIKKVKDDKRAIIFIDEIHNIIGAGGAEGAIDASNILKPYLARGDFQCIGATTYDEYVKIFEKERGLERRFQMIRINEPGRTETIDMLRKIRPNFESFHQINIPDAVIEAIVDLSSSYISDKHFPDKAIDVLDYALVKARGLGKKHLDEETVIKVIENLHSVKIIKEEKAALLKAELRDRILGQDQAIDQIVSTIATIENGLIEDHRPLAVLLFVGPTGVGKSEIAKIIAETYFGSPERLIKLDMQEYSEPAAVTKLIGSPPGYVGFEKQSYLVDAIRKMPYSVVLIDEVEKGHRDVLDLFLNVFDEGFFTDAAKRKISFKNAIIIMTSNLGHGDEVFGKMSLGFTPVSVCQEEIDKAIKQKLRPEFINRIDQIVRFDSLQETTCSALMNRYLAEYRKKVNMELALDEADFKEILASTEISRFGARAVRREVRKYVQAQIEKSSKKESESLS